MGKAANAYARRGREGVCEGYGVGKGILNLDPVITVERQAAHLGGAQARLGDWGGVMERVVEALRNAHGA
jgi:hypothetical protein